MNSRAGTNLETCREQVQAPVRQAWVDPDEKLISFHPINSGQLLKAIEPLFWEMITSLSDIGYRIQ